MICFDHINKNSSRAKQRMLKVCEASLLMHHKQYETNFELIFITFFGMTHISCIFPDDVSRIFPDDVSDIFPDDISRILNLK